MPDQDPWLDVAEAAERDDLLDAQVVSVSGLDIQVDVLGALGRLQLRDGENVPEVGDTLRVKVTTFNRRRRVLQVHRF
jgi:hypothetical protein